MACISSLENTSLAIKGYFPVEAANWKADDESFYPYHLIYFQSLLVIPCHLTKGAFWTVYTCCLMTVKGVRKHVKYWQ